MCMTLLFRMLNYENDVRHLRPQAVLGRASGGGSFSKTTKKKEEHENLSFLQERTPVGSLRTIVEMVRVGKPLNCLEKKNYDDIPNTEWPASFELFCVVGPCFPCFLTSRMSFPPRNRRMEKGSPKTDTNIFLFGCSFW